MLIFSNKSQIILSHQLTKQVPDNFTVLEWDQIDKDIYDRLYKNVHVFGRHQPLEYEKIY